MKTKSKRGPSNRNYFLQKINRFLHSATTNKLQDLHYTATISKLLQNCQHIHSTNCLDYGVHKKTFQLLQIGASVEMAIIKYFCKGPLHPKLS